MIIKKFYSIYIDQWLQLYWQKNNWNQKTASWMHVCHLDLYIMTTLEMKTIIAKSRTNWRKTIPSKMHLVC